MDLAQSIVPMHGRYTIVRFSNEIHYIDFDPTIHRSKNVKLIPVEDLLLFSRFITMFGGWILTISQLPPLEAREKFLKRMAWNKLS